MRVQLITGKTALDVLDAAIDGRDLTQSSRMIFRESNMKGDQK